MYHYTLGPYRYWYPALQTGSEPRWHQKAGDQVDQQLWVPPRPPEDWAYVEKSSSRRHCGRRGHVDPWWHGAEGSWFKVRSVAVRGITNYLERGNLGRRWTVGYQVTDLRGQSIPIVLHLEFIVQLKKFRWEWGEGAFRTSGTLDQDPLLQVAQRGAGFWLGLALRRVHLSSPEDRTLAERTDFPPLVGELDQRRVTLLVAAETEHLLNRPAPLLLLQEEAEAERYLAWAVAMVENPRVSSSPSLKSHFSRLMCPVWKQTGCYPN